MPDEIPSAIPSLPPVPTDVVFAALGDPSRRRILRALAQGELRTASDLRGATGKRLDATLKHLVALRGAGLIVAVPNPADGRRQLYKLAPHIIVRTTPEGREMDLGCAVVRLWVS